MKYRNLPAPARLLLLSLAIIFATAATALAATRLISGRLEPRSHRAGIPALSGELHAMCVRTRGNADFPAAPAMPAKELQMQLDGIASFAHTYGYNAIFFEAVPGGEAFYRSEILPASAYWTGKQDAFTFFDPLGYLVDAAKEFDIQVYAVVDPFALPPGEPAQGSPAAQNPGWAVEGALNPAEPGVQKLAGRVAGELTARYDLAGIVFEGVDSEIHEGLDGYGDQLARLLAHAHDGLRHKDAQRVGMVARAESALDGENPAARPLRKGDLDFVVTVSDAGAGSDGQAAELAGWSSLCKGAPGGAAFYPLHEADDGGAFSHQIDNRLYFERAAGAGGIVVSSYGSLNTDSRAAAYSLAATFAQKPPENTPALGYPSVFSVTRPTGTITVDPSWGAYFITGTSDPAQPLIYKGKELERGAKNGLWGALVNVPYGENTYTFSQGDASRTVTIIRPRPAQAQPINTIVKSSVYPANPEAVLPGQLLRLSCTAPAGGRVTATVGGLTQELTQSAPAADGMPAVYQGVLDLSPAATAGQVANLGPVSYSLNYGGMNNTQQSAGEVYAAGEGARPVARMKTAVVPVNRNPKDDGLYAAILKKDCVDYIVENTGGFYRLSFGGYVLKNAVEIEEGAATAQNTVSSISMSLLPKGEQLTISGTARPAFTGELSDGALTVTLYNTAGFETMNAASLDSALCETIETTIDAEKGSVALTFRLKPEAALLGWDVLHRGNDTVLYLRRPPMAHTDTARPLSDVSVVIDPGHGGDDPGAAGVPGQSGPMEKTLNLANALALKSRLEAFGATVTLTHTDETMTLNDRMELAEKADADVFVSCHHNSLAETADANTVSGIEVYYYNDQSRAFAENLGAGLAQDTGRRLRFTEQSYYRVTMMTARPSVLVESGYLCNPAEYEALADDYAMTQYGNAVADAVLQLFL